MEIPQLEMTLDDIKWGIVNAKKLKVKQEVRIPVYSLRVRWIKLGLPQSITVLSRRNRLRLYVDGSDKYYRLRELKRLLPEVVVKVISPTI